MEVSQVKNQFKLNFILFEVEQVQEIQQEVIQQQPIHTLIPRNLQKHTLLNRKATQK